MVLLVEYRPIGGMNWIRHSCKSKPRTPLKDSRFNIFSFVRSKYLKKKFARENKLKE